MKREEVEALLAACVPGSEAFVPAMDEMTRRKMRALCRAWLALDAGAPAIMDTRTALGVCAPTEADFPSLYALQGKRVRIVPVAGATP